MAVVLDMSNLQEHANFLKEALGKSQTNYEGLVKILGSFDHRLSELESAMRPTQVRTHNYRTAHENIEKTLKSSESILAQYDVSRQVEGRIREGPRKDLDGYLVAMTRLQSAAAFFEKNNSFKSADAALAHAKGLLKEAVDNIEEEFRSLLATHTKSVDPSKIVLPAANTESQNEDSDSAQPQQQQQPIAIPVLISNDSAGSRIRKMAESMIKSEYQNHCLRVYKDQRSALLEQGLKRIGVEKLPRERMDSMSWGELESRIDGWRKQIRLAIHVIFMAERNLAETLFKGLDPHGNTAFAELADLAVTMLFSFGEAVARSKKSPEKLSVLMDMYETMRDLMPQVAVVFSGAACSPVRAEAQGLLQRLAAGAKEAFNNFEDAVLNEDSKQAPADGSTHGLTSYVVNYIKFLHDYKATLQELFQADKMSEATIRVFNALHSNLEQKAKLYKDPAQAQIFLMNNIHYIVYSVRKSELKEVLGDEWIQRHRRVVQQHATAYQKTSWSKVFQLFTAQGLTASGKEDGQVSKTLLKERFKTFNQTFEELHRTQCVWKITDPELRSAVQLQIAEILLPAYRSFVTRYTPILDTSMRPFSKSEGAKKHIRFTEENLDSLLGEFFQGRESRNILVAKSAPGLA